VKYAEALKMILTAEKKTVCKLLGAAFSILHRTPGLKMLALHFDTHDIVTCVDNYGDEAMRDIAYAHQWDIVYAIWSNKNPLPKLQSLEFHGWLFASKSASYFDEAPIASWLAPSLRHLSISVPQRGVKGTENWESRTLFWSQFVVPRVLQSAVNLESLTISRDRARDTQDLGISLDELPTYPRLAALSLRNIVWEEGTVGEGNVVTPPPLEDFIVRHSKTLKKLELRDCSIGIGIRSPLRCFWEDVFKRLAAALTELVELEVKFKFERYESLLAGRGFNEPSDHIFYIGVMADQDAPALEEFRAVVKNQGMGGSKLNDG
jgi:hypothetical protein